MTAMNTREPHRTPGAKRHFPHLPRRLRVPGPLPILLLLGLWVVALFLALSLFLLLQS